MPEKLIHLPIEEARAAKWRRGREHYGPVFIGHPLDFGRHELRRRSRAVGLPDVRDMPEDLRDLCERIRAIYDAAEGNSR